MCNFIDCSTMTFYYNDSWLGFLTETFVRQSINMCQKDCPGCRDEMKSAILHLHHQLSLLDKIKKYFEEIRGNLLTNIPAQYSRFEKKVPHSDNLEKDKVIYCGIARSFLITSTPETLYYGRYISDEIDGYISEGFSDKIIKNKKKVT